MSEHEHLWTLEEALTAAVDLLGQRFEEVDQQAAVALAGLLYSTRMRDSFLREHQEPTEAYP